jgi:uncharacterized coiled-coil protein SlyX
MREKIYPGKSEETVKSGLQSAFSSQSKHTKTPKIQGWNVPGIDAQGKPVSTLRWLLAGQNPQNTPLWLAPSERLPNNNCNQGTGCDARVDISDTIVVRNSSEHVEESDRENKEGMASCADICYQDTTSPEIENGAMTGEQLTSKEPVVQDEIPGMTAYDEWSAGAQGDYWGFQVRKKKDKLKKLRGVENVLTELSSRLTELRELWKQDTSQLKDLEGKMEALQATMRQRASDIEHIEQDESRESANAIILRKGIDEVDETLEQYYAQDD